GSLENRIRSMVCSIIRRLGRPRQTERSDGRRIAPPTSAATNRSVLNAQRCDWIGRAGRCRDSRCKRLLSCARTVVNQVGADEIVQRLTENLRVAGRAVRRDQHVFAFARKLIETVRMHLLREAGTVVTRQIGGETQIGMRMDGRRLLLSLILRDRNDNLLL